MPVDQIVQPWSIRSTLVSLTDLSRSVAFYREVGPFEEVARDVDVVILGDVSPRPTFLILREARSMHHIRHGQQALGLRSISFDVGAPAELDRVESVLRKHDLFTSRGPVADAPSELLRGRDPDNLPLVFVSYPGEITLSSEYYRTIASLVYSLDI